MPWDDTTLVVADLIRSGEKGEKLSIDGPSRRVVAGGNGKGVSAMEPVWFLSSSSSEPGSTEFRLAFISEETGWWNVYAEGEGGGERRDNFFSKVSLLPFFCLREERKNPRSPPLTPPSFHPSLQTSLLKKRSPGPQPLARRRRVRQPSLGHGLEAPPRAPRGRRRRGGAPRRAEVGARGERRAARRLGPEVVRSLEALGARHGSVHGLWQDRRRGRDGRSGSRVAGRGRGAADGAGRARRGIVEPFFPFLSSLVRRRQVERPRGDRRVCVDPEGRQVPDGEEGREGVCVPVSVCLLFVSKQKTDRQTEERNFFFDAEMKEGGERLDLS